MLERQIKKGLVATATCIDAVTTRIEIIAECGNDEPAIVASFCVEGETNTSIALGKGIAAYKLAAHIK